MDLERTPPAELEALFRTAAADAPPSGSFRGRFLCWLPGAGARRLHVRAVDSLLFRALPFGVDFDAAAWWFGAPRLRVGRFRSEAGPSRWRDARVLRLRYDPSRLPGPLRRYLYDEVQVLGPDALLGIGGVNAGPGEGDHFFFSLRRIHAQADVLAPSR